MAVPRRFQPIFRSFGPILRTPGGPICRQSPIQRLLQLQHQTRCKYTSPGSKQRRVPLSQGNPNAIPDPQFNNSIPENEIRYETTEPKSNQDWDTLRLVSEEAKAKTEYLRPAIFVVAFSVYVFIALAYLEVKMEGEAQENPTLAPQVPMVRRREPPRIMTPVEAGTHMWSDFHPIAKLTFGIMGTNGVVHLITAAAPKYKELLAHTPAFNRRWTLVTSNFVHFGFWHIALNTWACYNFLIPAGYSPLFQGDPYHLLAFFLSTGTIASYGQHLATLPTSPMSMQTLVRSGGASGALFGAFAVFCMQYPNAQVGIVLVPFSVAAINMLPAAMAFDLWGAVRGFKFTKMGHAAHLAGACVGAGYSYLNGKAHLWDPLVGFWRRRLKKA